MEYFVNRKFTIGIFMTDKNPQLAKRIEQILATSGLNQREFAERIKTSQGTVSKFLKGTVPNPYILKRIAKLGNTTVDFLLAEEDESHPPLNVIQFRTNGTIPEGTPLAEVRIWEWAGMGNAYAVREQDFELGLEPIRTIMLPQEVVNDWHNAFEAHGESMEPTLSEGDIAGIDFSDKTFRSGKLFAIHSAYEGYAIKRLEDQSPYGILIKSDNPSHNDYRIDHDKIEHDLQIVGRVAWIFGQRKARKKG